MGKVRFDIKLQKDVQRLIDAKRVKDLGELSTQASVSKASLSLWLHSKYPSDPSNLESKLRTWLRSFSKAMTLSAADEHRLVRIHSIIDEAQRPEALVNRIQKERG